MVLVWERPTVRTQEGVPQSNMVKPILAQIVVIKKKPLDYLSFFLSLSLSLSLLFFLGKFLKVKNIQVKSRQVKSIGFNLYFCNFQVFGRHGFSLGQAHT